MKQDFNKFKRFNKFDKSALSAELSKHAVITDFHEQDFEDFIDWP